MNLWNSDFQRPKLDFFTVSRFPVSLELITPYRGLFTTRESAALAIIGPVSC
jgi:hypothetical protein